MRKQTSQWKLRLRLDHHAFVSHLDSTDAWVSNRALNTYYTLKKKPTENIVFTYNRQHPATRQCSDQILISSALSHRVLTFVVNKHFQTGKVDNADESILPTLMS